MGAAANHLDPMHEHFASAAASAQCKRALSLCSLNRQIVFWAAYRLRHMPLLWTAALEEI